MGGVKRSAPPAADGDGNEQQDRLQDLHVSVDAQVPRSAKKARLEALWQDSCSALRSARVSLEASVATNKARGSALCSQITQWCAQVAVDRIGHGLRHAPETMPAWNAAVGKLGMLRPQRTIEGRNEAVANVAATNLLSEEVKPADGEISPEAESIMRDAVCNEQLIEEQQVVRPDAMLDAAEKMDSSDGELLLGAESGVPDIVCNEESAEDHYVAPRDAFLHAEQVVDASCTAEVDTVDEVLYPAAEGVDMIPCATKSRMRFMMMHLVMQS